LDLRADNKVENKLSQLFDETESDAKNKERALSEEVRVINDGIYE